MRILGRIADESGITNDVIKTVKGAKDGWKPFWMGVGRSIYNWYTK